MQSRDEKATKLQNTMPSRGGRMFTKIQANHEDEELIQLLKPFASIPYPDQEQDLSENWESYYEEFIQNWVYFCIEAFNQEDLDKPFNLIFLNNITQRLQEKLPQTALEDSPTFPSLITDLLLFVANIHQKPLLQLLGHQTIAKTIKTVYEKKPHLNTAWFEERFDNWYNNFCLNWVSEKIKNTDITHIEAIWQAYNLGIFNKHQCENAFYQSFQAASSSQSETIKITQDNDLILCHAFSAYLEANELLAIPKALLEGDNKISSLLGITRTDINTHSKTNQLFYKALWTFLIDKKVKSNPDMYQTSFPILNQKHLYLTVNQSNPLDSKNKEMVLKLIELNKFKTFIINQGELTLFYYNSEQGIVINDKFMSNEQVDHITKVANLIQEEKKQNISQAKSSFGFYYLAPVEARLEKLAQAKKNSEDKVESHGLSLI